MNDPLKDALVFIVQTPFNLFILVVMLRLMLQYTKADFYNPISQFTVKLTSPVLVPMRRVLPAVGNIDTASFVLLFLLQLVMLLLTALIFNAPFTWLLIIVTTVANLVSLLLYVYQFGILILIIASWIAPGNYNPVLSILESITRPVLAPFRRIPPIAGMDFSPMFAIMALVVTQKLLIPLIMSIAR